MASAARSRHGPDRRRALGRQAVGPRRPRGDRGAPARGGRRALDAREAEVGEADWAQVERIVLVRTIDSLWVEHLTELDDMRRGIGLRGYAQQDPLNEFRREAFRMYEELRELIRHGVASSIFRVTVQRSRRRAGTRRSPRPSPKAPRRCAAADGNGAGAGAGRRPDGRSAQPPRPPARPWSGARSRRAQRPQHHGIARR